MRKNLYNHGAATIASVSPIGAGGSSAVINNKSSKRTSQCNVITYK